MSQTQLVSAPTGVLLCDAARLLKETLQEEKLSQLAEGKLNREAA
jgi:hypothetical protein